MHIDRDTRSDLHADERYRTLVDAITDYAIFMLDVDGRVASWNSGAERFKGFQAHEIIGQHFSRFYTDEDRKLGLPKKALHAAAVEGRFEREGWRVRKDGSHFWAHVIIDPIRSPEGELLGFAKVTRDLSERKQAQESLRASEEQFRRLLEGVSDYAIYMISPDGLVSSWNSGARKIKGYSPDEIIGQHFSRFYTEEDRQAGAPREALKTAAMVGRYEKEAWRVRKDGTRFWAHVVIDAISNDDGELIGFAKITRDITERRNAQQALEEARKALLQAQKLESIGQLTGGIAHDFNNLLTAVLGSLELLKKRMPDDPRALRLLDNAVQGAQRGAALTQRMLAFARKQDLTLESVVVPELVEDMTGLLEQAVGGNILLNVSSSGDVPPAFCDANQLEAALLNLVVNARDAMPDGGLLTVTVSRAAAAGRPDLQLPLDEYVSIAVTDTGSGMSTEAMARATEPFYTTKGIGKGTGLGLSMVHGMAEQSKGRLVLSSQPGKGTRAEILLPIAEPGSKVRTTAPPSISPPQSARVLHVLAVDDDPLVLTNTAAILEDLGHRVQPVASAVEALRQLRTEKVDLVLTDYSMPGMSGLELAEHLAVTQPHLPVIIATGFAELPRGQSGKIPRISKPYSQDDLARLLDQLGLARDG